MTADIVDLDVRPILASGSDPFAEIMAAVAALAPDQGLRIVAPFRPGPLLQVLASKGFSHKEQALTGGDWEVIFHRRTETAVVGTATATAAAKPEAWPEPVRHLDNRDLDPPEPMVRILAAIEELSAGDVLSALLRREPTFLLPELAKRGHHWQGGFDPDGKTYRLLVHVGKPEAQS
jgi:uncharacterized protein (DUF2249 family)